MFSLTLVVSWNFVQFIFFCMLFVHFAAFTLCSLPLSLFIYSQRHLLFSTLLMLCHPRHPVPIHLDGRTVSAFHCNVFRLSTVSRQVISTQMCRECAYLHFKWCLYVHKPCCQRMHITCLAGWCLTCVCTFVSPFSSDFPDRRSGASVEWPERFLHRSRSFCNCRHIVSFHIASVAGENLYLWQSGRAFISQSPDTHRDILKLCQQNCNMIQKVHTMKNECEQSQRQRRNTTPTHLKYI